MVFHGWLRKKSEQFFCSKSCALWCVCKRCRKVGETCNCKLVSGIFVRQRYESITSATSATFVTFVTFANFATCAVAMNEPFIHFL